MWHFEIHSGSCVCLYPGAKSWLLHHGKASAHTSLLVPNFWPITTSYSPDLVPCEFFLFPKLKRHVKGRQCPTSKKIAGRAQDYTKKCLSEVLQGLEKALAQVYYI